jgi:hypothetical protein
MKNAIALSITFEAKEAIVNGLKGTAVVLSLLFVSSAYAQTVAQADQGAASSAHSDEIVKMRMQIAVANMKYSQQAAAVEKVFDHKKAQAAKERNAAIAAAHNGVSGQ